MTKEESLAYCAGFIDGDGSLFMTAAKQSDGNGLYFRPTVTAIGINRKPLDRIAGVLGGEVRPAGEVLRCALHYGKATRAAKKLEPFLLIKKQQSQVFQEFQVHVDSNRVGGRQSQPAHVKEQRMEFVTRVTAMNHRILPPEQFSPHTKKKIVTAYIAGLLESEGCFAVGSSGGKPAITITVGMTDMNLIFWLKEVFGGWAGELKGRTKADKAIYVWRVNRNAAYAVCKAVRPYLTFKKEQADILIRYQNSVLLWKRRLVSVNQFNLPDSVRRQREDMKTRIQYLHKHAGATTNSEQPLSEEVSDSLSYSDGKAVEHDRNDHAAVDAA